MLANGCLPWAPSSYIVPAGGSQAATGNSLGINTLRLYCQFVPNNVRLIGMVLETTVASDAGGIVRMGVWRANANGFPQTLMTPATGTTVPVDGATGFQETNFGLSNGLLLPSGFYWFGGQMEVATVQATFRSMPTAMQAVGSTATGTSNAGYTIPGNGPGNFIDLPGTALTTATSTYRFHYRTGVL